MPTGVGFVVLDPVGWGVERLGPVFEDGRDVGHVNLPLGDVGDIAAIDADKARAANGDALAAIAKKNGTDQVIVALAVPRAAAALATATSPSGWTACTPVGEITTGSEMSCPITVVASSRFSSAPITCGAKPSSLNAALLPLTVSNRT